MTDISTLRPPARVLVVDDSATIRKWLGKILDRDPRLTVVAQAGSASEARDVLKRVPCDVMTLDVEMPGLSGIEFLAKVMRHRPMPVVMFSALTEAGSDAAIEALALGAVDCIPKPKFSINKLDTEAIAHRVWMASRTSVGAKRSEVPFEKRPGTGSGDRIWKDSIALIGASTGGVAALEVLFEEIDDNDMPVVVAQHMPDGFIASFCRRLAASYRRNFVVAEDGLVLRAGHGIIALGKSQSTRLARRDDGSIICKLGPPSPSANFHPSVDDLFYSAVDQGLSGSAALLTGMGNDGAKGLAALQKANFRTFAQSEESCVVFGMPRAALLLEKSHSVDDPAGIGRALIAKEPCKNHSHRRMK